jgi:hypothetical protein
MESSVSSKMLTAPELEFSLSYPGTDITPMPGKQRAIFDAKFKAGGAI